MFTEKSSELVIENCRKMGERFGIDDVSVSVISRKELLTNRLPIQLQIFDPDLIFSWKKDRNGIGRCIMESLDYSFDFTGKISRQPGKASDRYFRLLQKHHKNCAQVKTDLVHNGTNQMNFQPQGRLIFSIYDIARHNLNLDEYSIKNVASALGLHDILPELDRQTL